VLNVPVPTALQCTTNEPVKSAGRVIVKSKPSIFCGQPVPELIRVCVTYDSSNYIVGIDVVNAGYDWLLLDPTLAYVVGDSAPSFISTFGEDSGWVIPTMMTDTTTSTVPVSGGTAAFGDLTVDGDLTVTGDIRVRPDSIYLGGLKLSTSDGATLLLNDSPISSSGTGDITFNGVKIIGDGTASGDGLGYSTIELVPDNDLYSISPGGDFGYGGQYLVIDPTSPNHIHIRAGGPQDEAAAQLILGGEKANVIVRDQDNSFTENHHVIINSQANDGTPYTWQFDQNGDLNLPTNGGIVFDRANTTIRVGMGFHIASGEGISIDAIDETDPANLVYKNWYFGSDGNLTFPDTTVQETAWAGGRVVTVPTHSTGAIGDLEGDLSFNNGYIYYCTADYGQVGHQVSVATAYNGATALNTNSFQLTKSADTLQIAVGDIISDSDGGATSIVNSVSSDDNYTYVGTGSMAYQAVFPLTFTSTDYVSGGNIWKRVAWSNDTW